MDKEKDKENSNKYGSISPKIQLKLDDSMARKNASCILDHSSFIKDKTVKEILGEINLKLTLHKKTKNKEYSTIFGQ